MPTNLIDGYEFARNDNDVAMLRCHTACRPAAELASFWNKPIISWVATDPSGWQSFT